MYLLAGDALDAEFDRLASQGAFASYDVEFAHLFVAPGDSASDLAAEFDAEFAYLFVAPGDRDASSGSETEPVGVDAVEESCCGSPDCVYLSGPSDSDSPGLHDSGVHAIIKSAWDAAVEAALSRGSKRSADSDFFQLSIAFPDDEVRREIFRGGAPKVDAVTRRLAMSGLPQRLYVLYQGGKRLRRSDRVTGEAMEVQYRTPSP